MGFVITGVINLCFEMTNEGEDEKAQVYTGAPRGPVYQQALHTGH